MSPKERLDRNDITAGMTEARRRTFLKAVGASGVATMGGLAGCLGDDDDDDDDDTADDGDDGVDPDAGVLVGAIIPRSGALSALGETQENGTEIAIDYINNELGGINGEEVDVIYEDTATDPETGREGAARLVEAEDVDVLVGGVSGAVAATVSDYAAQENVPYWTYGGAKGITGENCNRATFRYTTNTVQDARGAVPWCLDELGSDVWIHYADYAYGQDIAEDFEAEIEDNGGTVIGESVTPLGETEYGTYMTEIQSADPDWVVMGVTGADLIAFSQQANDFGLTDSIDFFSINVTTQDIRQGIGDSGVGIYGNVRYFHEWDSEENDALVDAYLAEYDQPPTDPAMVNWTSLMLHAEAAEAAGSVEADDVIEALEGLETGSPMGPTEIRACDHQATREIPIGQIVEPDEYDWPSLEIVHTTPGEDAMRSCEETGCDMNGS